MDNAIAAVVVKADRMGNGKQVRLTVPLFSSLGTFVFHFICFILCAWMFCLHVCLCTTFMWYSLRPEVTDPLGPEL